MPKSRQAAQELSVHRRSALNVRLFLRDFCSEFLENCYNPLMGAVKVRVRERGLGIEQRGDMASGWQGGHPAEGPRKAGLVRI